MDIISQKNAVAHRFFFTLKPDDETARRTRAWAEEKLGSRGLLSADRYHVTLALTGDFLDPSPVLTEKLLAVGASVYGPPFSLVLDVLSSSDRVAVLQPTMVPPALKHLQKCIRAGMEEQNVDLRNGSKFDPHQTLAYRKGEPFQCSVNGFLWEVNEFALIHSHVGLSRHDTVAKWPLRPRDSAQPALL